MTVHAIEFKILNKCTNVDIKELILDFICSLKNNGQILSKYLLCINNGNYVLYATTPKSNSLDECFDSVYVKRDRNNLRQICDISVTEIGVNTESQEYCSCTARSAIEMQTFANDVDSAFTCCDCGKPIALYELPLFDKQEDRWEIVDWQNTYSATDALWLDSLNDRFTGNQLVNVNSVLNKHGREIAAELERRTATKVYYNIFDDLTSKVKFVEVKGKNVRLCPGCGKEMKYVKFGDGYERFVCDSCKLSSDLPNE